MDWAEAGRWLEKVARLECEQQWAQHLRKRKSPKSFRYDSPQWHRDAVFALGKQDEATFKHIRLERTISPKNLNIDGSVAGM